MGRSCSICTHPQREQIDAALLGGVSYRDIAGQWVNTATNRRLAVSALSRHRRDHLSPALTLVRKRREAAGAATLTDQVRALVEMAGRIRARGLKSGNAAIALAAMREQRAGLELVARLTGEYSPAPASMTINVMSLPEFQAAQAAILEELDGHPAIKKAVAARLRALPAPGDGERR